MIFLQIFSNASNFVEGVDTAFMIIFGISLFFLLGISAVMIYFVFRYHKTRNPKATQIDGSTTLEILWTIVPLVLVIVMFYFGYKGYAVMRDVPDDAMEVTVIGYMWDWDFQYENGKVSKDLYVPIDKAVKLNLVSLDVIHSFYIPAFRVKEDVVPGRENYMWFIGQKLGEFNVLCAEYCGLRHSYMDAKTIVVSQSEFDTWLADYNPEAETTPKGLELLKANACIGCHSLDGTKLVGPSLLDVYASKKIVLVNGKEKHIVADDEYLLKAINNPNEEIVKGYQPNMMQSYTKLISEEDQMYIIDYLRTLKSK